MEEGKTLATLSSWGPGYEVSLEFYIHRHVAGNSAGYAWFFIVHSAEDPNMGYGAPAVWLNSNGYLYIRSEVIFKKSSNLYCRLDLGRVLMVGTKVSKGFFV